MIKQKKAMEFSVGALVSIILGMAMFIAGVTIFYNIVSQSEQMEAQISERLREDMLARFDDGSRLFIPENSITLNRRDDTAVFYYGIHNIHNDPKDFKITFNYNQSELEIISLEYDETVEIDGRSKEIYMLIVDASNAPRGQHRVNIEIKLEGDRYASSNIYVIK